MAKLIEFEESAKEKILKGVSKATRAIGSTLGPRGKNVAFARKWGSPTVVHDGVTVAKEIDLVDPYENMGAQFIKEASSRTNDEAGDGTTTAAVITEGMVIEGNKNMTAGFNVMALKGGIESAVADLIAELDNIKVPIEKPQEVEHIAIISAQDEKIGKIVATALNKMGKDSVITVEESQSTEISIEYKQGMEFDQGYVSPHFINNPVLQEASYEDPYILLTDKRLTKLADLVPFLQGFYPEGTTAPRPLIIIADDISGDALAVLAVNRMQGGVPIIAVKAPNFGDVRKSVMEDIAIVTGGKFISSELGISLDNIDESYLGRAKRVTSTRNSTMIVGGVGLKEAVQERIQTLRNTMEKEESAFNREKLQERIAKLTTGIAVINVGANSEVEMREKKERIIDAISAARAALDDGIVPGGETALLRAKEAVMARESVEMGNRKVYEESIGYGIVMRAIEAPFRKLMSNGGFDPGEKMGELKEAMKKGRSFGIDQTDGKAKDLLKAGIIDPVKVTKSALKNAASVAIMIMTIETAIVDAPEEKKPNEDNY